MSKQWKSIKLVVFSVLIGGFAVLELICGVTFNSLVLLADSLHMTSDLAALAISFMTVRLSDTPPNNEYTYGWARLQIVGALANSLFLMAISFLMYIEAAGHIITKETIHEPLAISAVGCVGLVVNTFGMTLFGHGHSHFNCFSCPKFFSRGASKTHEKLQDIESFDNDDEDDHGESRTMMLRDINSIDELGSSNSHTALHFEEEPRSQARQPSSSPNSAAYNRSKSGPSKGGTHSISDSSDEDDEGHSDGDSDGRGHGHARNTANSDSGSTSHHRHSPDCDADEHGHAHNSHDHAHTSDTHAHAHTERHNHSHADSSHDHSHVNAGDMHGHTHGEDAHGHIHDDGDAHGHSHGEHDDNMYAVYIHVVGDVVGSLGVISSGLLNHYMRTPHNYLIDPMITCLVATILMMASFPVVKRTSRVLMQATPKTIDMEGIKGRLLDIAGLESIQTFNIWELVSNRYQSALRIECAEGVSTADIQRKVRCVLEENGVKENVIELSQRNL